MIKTMMFGNEKQYVLSIDSLEYVLCKTHNTYSSEWYHGCYANDVKPYYRSKVGESRFALSNRSVRYFARDPQRIDYEINRGDLEQTISGSFKISKVARIFNLSRMLENDFIKIILKNETEEAYRYSSCFAHELFKDGFDGILYEPCTIIQSAMGMGPCNDPMLVLFEPKEDGRSLYYFYHADRVNREGI